jgi:hypothetical protein
MSERNPQDDELIGETQEAAEERGTGGRAMQAANLFDLRRIIGGLFILYGVILTIVGLFDSQAEIDKAAGVHINLWEGLAMIALGALFLLWAFTRPLGEQLSEAGEDEPSGSPEHSAPRGGDAAALASHERSGRTRGDRDRPRRRDDRRR